MRILVLGVGKTGKLVAEVAAERGHSVHVLDAKENKDAAALTAPFVAGFDIIIDFTTPEAVVSNMRACLATGAKMVIGTTGWYDKLDDMKSLAERRGAALLYGTNFSIGVQKMLDLAKKMSAALKDSGYHFAISETHHESKLDSPSGTAITLRDAVLETIGSNNEVPIHATRTGEVAGIHTLEAIGHGDRLLLTHESKSRRPFAEGAVRAAEWLASRTGVYNVREVFDKL
ncbi:4-hydroxy-tetrahydrodipicolinate reductase [Granulicella mallensis]|uniref:4-hydroxy-tetrahydrodipicolinate reductase n=1 Tax=Granulicella mallensis (strain ATCC BAA-1857 / DSM 23137 / MP5ACTX8) TaxID=682795 RepID=G8NZF2_GRAMM|nr:4-hydroxy-tetrahydrodipicolinate reductase [Granulicella mallensis]AEU37980.1 dihydrodipicolinate reductase [Granulicella mallensis MP5ACTX8]